MNKDAESKFNQIVAEFKKVVDSVVSESLDRVHGELVPYVNEDTEHNAMYRAGDLVEKLINGDFDVIDGIISVDGWGLNKLTSFHYDKLVDKLAERCSDIAAQKKIERLENQLKEAWERNL